MRVTYDPDVDVLMIYLKKGEYAESNHVAPNIIMDFDTEGKALSIEILEAKHTLDSLTINVDLPSGVAEVHKAEEQK